MSQEVINVGPAPNDGLGDPLRTAFIKTNNNFSQLFSTSGVSGIANGTSNVNIPVANGNVVISAAGAANVLTVTGTGVNVAGTLNSNGLATLSNLSVTGTVISTGTIQGLAGVTAVTITASGNSSANNAVVTNLITVGQLSITGNIVAATVTGNITGGNLGTAGLISATSNITGGNVLTGGQVSATGNITAAFFSGNGAGLTGVVAAGNVGAASKLLNGTSEMNIPASGGNIIGNVAGSTNIFTLSTGGLYITGTTSASGNITGGNLLTGGLISSTGTVTGSSHLGSVVSVTANVTGGNILTGGLISATSTVTSAANITGGNVLTGGLISATANVTANNGMFTTIVNVASVTGSIVSITGNVTGGNLLTGGLISATSTITSAANITGGNVLTGGLISATSTITSAANITGGNVLTGGLISATSTITSAANITGGNVLTGGLISATANVTGGNVNTGGLITATGTITGGNLLTAGLASATGNVTGGNIVTAGVVSATGNLFGNVLSVNFGNTATAIINAGGNAVGNIGSSSTYFNRLFAQATTALYADLAEIYSADAEYPPGTVVSFGGDQEITKSVVEDDPRVAGVISEKPSYLMNSGLQAQHRAAVALTGRVPTLVMGPVAKGDMMVSAGNGWARASATPTLGTVIGKALVNFDGDSGIIEIVVGRQ